MGKVSETTESHRYSLARFFVVGFFLIILLALVGEIFLDYRGVNELAAIFGGWMTAVLGFYFFQQKLEHTQEEKRRATTLAENARIEAADWKGRRLRKITSSQIPIIETKKTIEEYKSLVEDLIRDLKNKRKP